MVKLQSIALIHRQNLEHNIKVLREIVNPAEIIAMVKADAYGHGINIVVPTLVELGVSKFAVANVSEAKEAVSAGAKWILILGTIAQPEETDLLKELATKAHIILAINNGPYYRRLQPQIPEETDLHIMIDTGMHRHGIQWDDEKEIEKLFKTFGEKITGIMTHFATAADNPTVYKLQKERFHKALSLINSIVPKRKLLIHAANTSAAALDPAIRYNAVRVGIGMYGYAEIPWLNQKLKPVMEVRSKITDIRTIPVGDGVSYGWRFVATKPTRAATVAIGYADGYKRALSGKTWAGINGKTAKQIGTIAMDYTIFDISDIPSAKVGDEVIIIGQWQEGAIWADTLAELIGTIPYEILVSIGKRVKRMMVP